MRKWLTIISSVLFIFFVLLLMLGYLLQTNKKETFALKNELDEQRIAQQEKREKQTTQAILQYEKDDATARAVQVDEIIANGLTCVDHLQCKSVTLHFNNQNCILAVNTIAFSQLSKLDLTFDTTSNCQQYHEKTAISCKQNTCQFD